MSYYYEFYNPVKVISGVNSIKEQLVKQLKLCNCNKILLITNQVTEKRDVFLELLDILRPAFSFVGVYKNIGKTVDTENVEKIISIYNLNVCDSIVAIGDRYVLDIARVVRLVLSQQEENIDKVKGYHMANKGLNIPLVLLPTTIGNGSEVANQCVVYDTKKQKNIDIVSSEMYANICMIDATILEKFKASTIPMYKVLVLANCIEGLSSRSCAYIIKNYAYTLIYRLKDVSEADDIESLDFKQKIMETSTLMAVMNCNNHKGVLSALSSTINLYYNIGYYECILSLLPSVLRVNLPILKDLYKELLYRLDSNAYAKYKDNQDEYFINYVTTLCDDIIKKNKLDSYQKILKSDELIVQNIIDKALFNCANLSNCAFVTEEYLKRIIDLSLNRG